MPLSSLLVAPGRTSHYILLWSSKPLRGQVTWVHLIPSLRPSNGIWPTQTLFPNLGNRHVANSTVPSRLTGIAAGTTSNNSHNNRILYDFRAREKARKPSPSEVLLRAVSEVRPDYYSAPRPEVRKPNLSYVNPRTLDSEQIQAYRKLEQVKSNVSDRRNTDISLQSILARFILDQNSTRASSGSLSYTFSEREIGLLRTKGYHTRDVGKWASTLTLQNSEAAAEIFIFQNDTPPLFVLLFFLRRKHLKVVALRILLTHVRQRVLGKPPNRSKVSSPQLAPSVERSQNWQAHDNGTDNKHKRLDSDSFIIIVIRLLRHARRAWPEAIPSIAEIFTAQLRRASRDRVGEFINEAQVSRKNFLCNRFLALLSRPTSLCPKLSIPFQEKAQFDVLRSMASNVPPLIITQEGYRAVARVQLARKKTAQEQEWARLKARSWPPWKENRTAMDEEKGVEFGFSRASRIMSQVHQAGYEHGPWEKIAKIYSGWDTDGSPTIQTRTDLANVPMLPLVGMGSQRLLRQLQVQQWAARVRATRTQREAWACFLAYEKSGALAHQNVYLAMYEKLVHDLQVPDSESEEVLPGDGKEVFSEPVSPQETTYVSEPVPTFQELVQRMTRNGVRPSGRCLAFLVRSSPTIALGIQILNSAGDAHGGGIKRLLSASAVGFEDVRDVPGYLFVSFLKFLFRYDFVPQTSPTTIIRFPHLSQGRYKLKMGHHLPLNYAYSLLVQCKPRYRPAWTTLMQAIVPRSGLPRFFPKPSPITTHLYAYQIMRNLIMSMDEIDLELDAEQFQLLCIALQRATFSCLNKADAGTDARDLLSSSPLYIRKLFHNLVGNSNASEASHDWLSAPRLFTTPKPTVLHSYVRALGLLRDYEGLYSLSLWMAEFHSELTERAEEQKGGPAALRRTLVALRVFLERSWESSSEEQSGAPVELVLLVKERIENVPEWRGWPTMDEVELYCMRSS